MAARSSWRAVRVRRSPHLVAYWSRGTLIACNYALGTKVELPVKACDLLNRCDTWTDYRLLRKAGVVPESTLEPLLDRMLELALLERSDRPRDPRAVAMDRLQAWNPQAGFFHQSTRDLPFASPRKAARFARRHGRTPQPPAFKRYPGAPTLDLPRLDGEDPIVQVLRSRRTWRRFSTRPVTRDELATLLALTAGVQQWVRSSEADLPLKTSPSGGARHAVECYVVVREISGLRAGIYHYAPDRHALTRIGGRVGLERLRSYVPGSEYFAKASAMIFFTAVFERILWRYPYARAYRAALIESGHMCQTFCLSATSLGLAPYSVLALADSAIEHDLGIDGITEAVLYAAGVGRRPRGSTWAPLPKGRPPVVRKNQRV